LTSLKEKVSSLPEAPGVYLMKDSKGRVIYVGKAKNLKARVSSYFSPSGPESPRTGRLVSQIADVDYLETHSEVDALLAEARLIKDIQPRYNVNLKDDKSYPFLEIVLREDFPRLRVTRTPLKGSKLYGPFIDVTGLHGAVEILQRIFKFRTCSLEISAADRERIYHRPCILGHIQMCSAPCSARIEKGAYRQSIRSLIRFLDGKRTALLRNLRSQMERASQELRFEEAAKLRDQIRALEALSKRGEVRKYYGLEPLAISPSDALAELQSLFHLPVMPRTIEGIDIATLSGKEAVGALVSFVDGKPFKALYRRYRIKTVAGMDDYAMMREVVTRRYRRLQEETGVFPDILLVDGGKAHLSVTLEALRGIGVSIGLVIAIAKREERLFAKGLAEPMLLARNSPALRLLQYVRDEAHRFAQLYHQILRRKKTLGPAERVAKKRRTGARKRERL